MNDNLRPVPRLELAFDIERALSKARGLWPRGRGDRNSLGLVANAMTEHLELCRIGRFRKPPDPGHRTPPP